MSVNVPKIEFIYRVLEYSLVDGDTVDVIIDRGFGDHKTVRVRVFGINTPEVRGSEKSAGFVAEEFADKWFQKHMENGIYYNSLDKPGKFGGRYLGDFFAYKDSGEMVFLAQTLLEEGLAKPYNKGEKTHLFTEQEIKEIANKNK